MKLELVAPYFTKFFDDTFQTIDLSVTNIVSYLASQKRIPLVVHFAGVKSRGQFTS